MATCFSTCNVLRQCSFPIESRSRTAEIHFARLEGSSWRRTARTGLRFRCSKARHSRSKCSNGIYPTRVPRISPGVVSPKRSYTYFLTHVQLGTAARKGFRIPWLTISKTARPISSLLRSIWHGCPNELMHLPTNRFRV